MASKYLTLEEAAKMLSVSTDELKRMREQGEIRGFADRGTWKFKQDDVEDLLRRRQADSDPEVQLFADEDQTSPEDHRDNFLLDSDDVGGPDQKTSDSDVRLAPAEESSIISGESDVNLMGAGSDSDIRLLADDDSGESPVLTEDDSDSDVKLVGSDSDSDVKLAEDDSDSDVKLVDSQTESDMSLAGKSSGGAAEPTENLLLSEDSDSDVQLIKDHSSSVVAGQDPEKTSVLDEGPKDSGISLTGDSSILLGDESGISLDSADGIDVEEEGITLAPVDDDSGISLDSGDSGISLETGDSGISLESVGDSGISLEEDSYSGTIPMMEALSDESVPETQFEIPSLSEDSGYQLKLGDEDEQTGVLDVQGGGDSGEATLDDATFEMDEEEAAFEAVDEFESDAELGLEEPFEEEEELDVFDAGEDLFAGEEGDEFAPRGAVRRVAVGEAEWGTGTFVALICATLTLSLLTVVTMDLVANTATASSPNPVSSALLNALGGMYK